MLGGGAKLRWESGNNGKRNGSFVTAMWSGKRELERENIGKWIWVIRIHMVWKEDKES